MLTGSHNCYYYIHLPHPDDLISPWGHQPTLLCTWMTSAAKGRLCTPSPASRRPEQCRVASATHLPDPDDLSTQGEAQPVIYHSHGTSAAEGSLSNPSLTTRQCEQPRGSLATYPPHADNISSPKKYQGLLPPPEVLWWPGGSFVNLSPLHRGPQQSGKSAVSLPSSRGPQWI